MGIQNIININDNLKVSLKKSANKETRTPKELLPLLLKRRLFTNFNTFAIIFNLLTFIIYRYYNLVSDI